MQKNRNNNRKMSSNKNFILQQIIDDLLNPSISLVGPLMKLTYFGRLTKNEELVEFTTNEISGYKEKNAKLPDYRKTIGSLIVEFQAYRNKHTAEVPVSMLEKPFNELLQYINITEGVTSIEKMGKEIVDSNNGYNEFHRPIPLELLYTIQPALRKLYKSDVRLDVIGAKLTGNGNVILEIPISIRTKLLEFVMKIADNFGYDIEIEIFNKENKNNQTINNIMKTVINNLGDGNILNTGNNNTFDFKGIVTKGDFEKLNSELQKQGIENEDINELKEIIQNETLIAEDKLGEQSTNWILKIIGKSLNGVGKIATGISSNILATMIKGYYGID